MHLSIKYSSCRLNMMINIWWSLFLPLLMYVYPYDNYEYRIILKIIINFHYYWRLDVTNVTIFELSLVVEHFISNFKLIYQNIVRAIWQKFQEKYYAIFGNMTRMMKIVLCEYIIVYVSLIFEQKVWNKL